MFDFFLNDTDKALFKKAFKETEDEPVIINLLSTDESLKEESSVQDNTAVARKNMSNKFQPSSFGKFFGPRKQKTEPVDMGNFSAWKNKNYRQAEQSLASESKTEDKFSLSDYLNKNASSEKFHESDKLVSETVKPVTSLSSDDPSFKKFSLDSYLHKLEQQSKVKDDFELNDDLLEPLTDNLVQEIVPTSSQDENFSSSSNVQIEDITFDENIKGETYSFEKSELDNIRNRLDKIEKLSQISKDKSNEKILTTEISDLAEDDDFDLEKLGVDELDDEDSSDVVESEKNFESRQESKPTTNGNVFIQINRNTEQSQQPDKSDVSNDDLQNEKSNTDGQVLEVVNKDENNETSDESLLPNEEKQEEGEADIVDVSDDADENLQEQNNDSESDDTIEEENVVSVDENNEDMQSEILTDEINEQSEIVDEKDGEQYETVDDELDEQSEIVAQQNPSPVVIVEPYVSGVQGYTQQPQDNQLLQQQQELQSKILEMIEANKKADAEAEEKLRQAELEKQRVAEEYEARLKELEESFKKRDEEYKKQVYLDKLKSDIKLKKAQTDFKKKEEEIKEIGKVSSEKIKIGVMLKKELENNLNVSNLEMDKKLLEVASKIKKEEFDLNKQAMAEILEAKEKEEKSKTTRKPGTARKKSSRSRTRTPRRKIDSDIIGSIDFD